MSQSTTPHIRAIPTVYRDTLFRSRTEARWAVLFDELGLCYEYEPEGWVLSNGLKYVPDFRLTYGEDDPSITAWVEVKRPLDSLSDQECQRMVDKADGLSRDSGDLLVIAAGVPDYSWYPCIKSCPHGVACHLCDATWEACDAIGERPTRCLFVPGRIVHGEDAIVPGDTDALLDAIEVSRVAVFDKAPFRRDLPWKQAPG